MKFLKKLFKKKTQKKPLGQTKIFSRGKYFILVNGKYIQGVPVAI